MRCCLLAILLLVLLPAIASAQDRFPPPDFRTGYSLPQTQTTAPRAPYWAYIDLAALALAVGIAAYLVLKKRSRRAVFVLMIASLIYFGFWRKGCVCSIGSIQNVSLAIWNPSYILPWLVAAYFLLPLIFALFFGRVFCAGVCPLGAIQDAVIWKPIQLPYWLETSLGLFAYAYLGLAVLLAGTGSDFAICQYDPFVAFFRRSGTAQMLFLGAVILLCGLFVGRIYCRFICPYGVLLRLISPLSRRRVSITPDKCIDCRLCEQSCPFGAIREPTTAQVVEVHRSDRLLFIAALALVVVLPLALAWVGYRAGPKVARVDPAVQLAELAWQADHGQTPPDSTARDRLTAFTNTGRPSEELYAQAYTLQHRFAVGTAWLGVWMGLVIALKLLGHAVRRPRSDYLADAGTCLACARCYKYCPVEKAANSSPQERPVPA